MLPILHLGPLAIQTPGLALIFGLWVGLALVERQAARHGSDPARLYNLAFIGLAAGIIGARLAYLGQHLSAFTADPLSIVSLNPGLLDLWGGIGAGIVAAALYGSRQKMPLWPTLDALTPLFGVFAIALGLAHLASGQAYGIVTNLPWAIELWGARRHPWQVYEILAATIILWLTWPRKPQPVAGDQLLQAGIRFWAFAALSAGMRLFLEAWRADSEVLLNGLRTDQLAAWVVLAISLWGLGARLRHVSEGSASKLQSVKPDQTQ
jgi:prolipoprotein diacylglyceryltransferase